MDCGVLGLHWSGEINAGELLVGVGTLLLAGVTAWLAKRTKEDVERGRESVEVAQRAVEMQDWPFLVATPDRPTFYLTPVFDRDTHQPSGDPVWACGVELVNYGRGPAIFDGANLLMDNGRELVDLDWRVESIYLPNEKPEAVGISLSQSPEDGEEGTLRLKYRSATGLRYETTHRLEVRPQANAIRLNFKQSRIET